MRWRLKETVNLLMVSAARAGKPLSPEEIADCKADTWRRLLLIYRPWPPKKKSPKNTINPKRVEAASSPKKIVPKPIKAEPFLTLVKRHTKPTIHLARQSDIPTSTRPFVKLGGLPKLPPGVSWPRIAKNMLGTEDVPLHFVGQIDCAEISKLSRTAVPFPPVGTLLIFADLSNLDFIGKPEQCKVIYTAKRDAEMQPVVVPEDLPNTFLMNRYKIEKSSALGFSVHPQLLPETHLCGLVSSTFPEREHLEDHCGVSVGTDWEEHEGISFDMNAKSLNEARQSAGIDDTNRTSWITPRHQIGGYVHPIQVPHPLRNETILLALDDDDQMGCMFDCGHLIFTVDERDLENCNFRNVKAYFYCD
ncbi:MAG: DUF1963 domain-containing protein [Pseudomonadota bacterium]